MNPTTQDSSTQGAGNDSYRCLSLYNPWSSLIAFGEKKIETRTWATDYRGWIAIHATKTTPADVWSICHTDPFRTVLLRHHDLMRYTPQAKTIDTGDQRYRKGLITLQQGAIVAFARLQYITRVTPANLAGIIERYGAEYERDFGNFASGRALWIFDRIVPLEEAIPTKGGRGLWEYAPLVKDRGRVRALLDRPQEN